MLCLVSGKTPDSWSLGTLLQILTYAHGCDDNHTAGPANQEPVSTEQQTPAAEQRNIKATGDV